LALHEKNGSMGTDLVASCDELDLKTGKALTSFADWDSAVKSCMTNTRARLGGNQTQSDALVRDVLDFMKVKQ
jgi:hypothetical protein